MPQAAIYRGRVLPGGLLVLDQPKDYAKAVRSFAGQFVEVVIRKPKVQRTPQANSFYWAVIVPAIAEAAGYTNDEAHEALKRHFLTVPDSGPLVKVRSTADLSVQEFSEYVDMVQVFGSQTFGICWD